MPRHTEGLDCVSDSMVGHRCNLGHGIVSLVHSRATGAHFEQRHTILTVTVHGAVCTWLLPIALDFLPSAFIASSGHAPTLLHGH